MNEEKKLEKYNLTYHWKNKWFNIVIRAESEDEAKEITKHIKKGNLRYLSKRAKRTDYSPKRFVWLGRIMEQMQQIVNTKTRGKQLERFLINDKELELFNTIVGDNLKLVLPEIAPYPVVGSPDIELGRVGKVLKDK